MKKAVEAKMAEAVNPVDGKLPVLYVVDTKEERFADENCKRLIALLDAGEATGAMRYRNGKAYVLNMDEGCWEYDCRINPDLRPDLAKYC